MDRGAAMQTLNAIESPVEAVELISDIHAQSPVRTRPQVAAYSDLEGSTSREPSMHGAREGIATYSSLEGAISQGDIELACTPMSANLSPRALQPYATFANTERDAPELARTAPVPSADDASGHVRRLAAECSAAFTPKAGGGSSAGFSAGEKHASGEFEARLGRISPSPQTPEPTEAEGEEGCCTPGAAAAVTREERGLGSDFARAESNLGALAEPAPPEGKAEAGGGGAALTPRQASGSRESVAVHGEQTGVLNGAKRYEAKGGGFVSESMALPRAPQLAADSSIHAEGGRGGGGGRDTSVHSTRGLMRRSVSRLGLIRVDSSMHSGAGGWGGDDSIRGDFSVHTQASMTPSWSRAVRGWAVDLSVKDPSSDKFLNEVGTEGAGMTHNMTIAQYVLSQGKIGQKAEQGKGGTSGRHGEGVLPEMPKVGFLRLHPDDSMPLAAGADNSSGLASLIAGAGGAANAPPASSAGQAFLFTTPLEKDVTSLIDDLMAGSAAEQGRAAHEGHKRAGITSLKQLLGAICGTMPGLNSWLEESIRDLRHAKDAPMTEATAPSSPGATQQMPLGAGDGDQGTSRVAAGWCSTVGAKLMLLVLLDAINVLLRGAAQVVLLNSPITGLFIIIALYVQSAAVATYGLIGLVSSTGAAWLLGMDSGLMHSGLFGYNGILVGLCLATFQDPADTASGWDVALLPGVVIYGAFSTLLFGALARLLVPYKVPPFTLPFNLAALMYFTSSTGGGYISTGLESALTPHADRVDGGLEYDWALLLEAIPKGVGQVYLADNTATGLIMIVGMLLCSPIAASAATLGSFLGILTGVAVGADPQGIYFGLWGYNAVLGAITVGGMFYVLDWPSLPFAVYCAVMCALTGPTVAAILSPVGVKAQTFPFCVCALIFYLLQGSMSKIIAVSLATASVPEEHCTRLRLTRFVAKTFRSMVGAQMEAAAMQRRAQLSKATRLELQVYKNAVAGRAVKALFDFLDYRKLGFVTLPDLCCLLVRCNYGHVPHAMLAEVWGIADHAGSGCLRLEELHEFVGIRLLLKKKREDLDSYLEMLDAADTGHVSLERINEALQAFGQEALSPSEQTEIIRQYCLHSQLNELGEMEWWRLADILQYSLMNCLLLSSS